MFLKNKNIIFKIRRSKVTDYAALNFPFEEDCALNIFVYMFLDNSDTPLTFYL